MLFPSIGAESGGGEGYMKQRSGQVRTAGGGGDLRGVNVHSLLLPCSHF